MGAYPVKIQIRLSKDIYARLSREALARGSSMAEIVREALGRYFEKDEVAHPNDPIWTLAGAGAVYGSSGLRDGAVHHDRYLYGETRS